ncbi:MAG: DUF2975 domain-containing protein [Clostridiales Family XIII bacterium]|jgi:hypothetical protein|nr:DUF2975 domain-containing protein [Clostridiales Family XIII bacterium]
MNGKRTGKSEMWNAKRSVKLSSVCTKAVIIAAIGLACALPFLYRSGFFVTYGRPNQDAGSLLLPLIYSCYAPALTALFSLNKLLTNIRNGDVFTARNVRMLRIISWSCYVAALLLSLGVPINLMFGIMAVLIAFIGLIVRVVKNVIAAAAELKSENDFTI